MGQQEIVTGSAVRRMILVLVVAALMAAMVAATAAPAFAAKGGVNFACPNGAGGFVVVNGGERHILEDQGSTCTKIDKRRI